MLLQLVKRNLPLANIGIHIKSPLSIQRDVLPCLSDVLAHQLCLDSSLILIRLNQDLGHGIHNQAVPPGVVAGAHVSGGTAKGYIDLVVYGAALSQQAPVQIAGGEVEGTGIDEGKGTAAGSNGGQLGEAHVVADGDANLAVLGQVDERHLVAAAEDFGFLKGDFAGDVDVEEVGLAVGGQQLAVRAKGQARVVVLFAFGFELGDGAADEVDVVLGGHGRQCVE